MEIYQEEGRVMTRSRMLSKTRALSTARSVAKSNLGTAVIRNSTTESTVHRLALRRLETENVWRLRELDKDRKQFLDRSNRLPGPILVVDRPPSVDVYQLGLAAGLGTRRKRSPGREEFDGPGYMRPTLRSATTAPIIPTIDAFRTLCTRTTSASSGQDKAAARQSVVASPVRFRSAVLPSWPLTEQDQCELRLHWNQHWIRLRQQQQRRRRADRSPSPNSPSSPRAATAAGPPASARVHVARSVTAPAAPGERGRTPAENQAAAGENGSATVDDTFLTTDKGTSSVRFDVPASTGRRNMMESTPAAGTAAAVAAVRGRTGSTESMKSNSSSTSGSGMDHQQKENISPAFLPAINADSNVVI